MEKTRKLARLAFRLKQIERNPQNETVADYVKIAQEYSNLLRQMEAERNMRTATPEQKNALNMEYKVMK